MVRPPLALLVAALAMLPARSQQPEHEPFGSIARHRDPAMALAEARAHAADGESERAIAMLWRLRSRAATLEEASARAELFETVERELAALDAEHERYAAAMSACAKRIVPVARAYRQKDWLAQATAQLIAAEEFDPAAAAAERRSLERAGGGAVETSEGSRVEAPELLRVANRRSATDTWSVVDDLRTDAEREDPRTRPIPGLRCQNTGRVRLAQMWYTNTAHTDDRIVVEYRPDRDGVGYIAGVAFGAKAYEYLAEIEYGERCRIKLCRMGEDDQWTEMIGRSVPRTHPLPQWQRLAIEIRGTRIRLILNDHEPLDVDVATPARGKVALEVTCESEVTTAVGFRRLTVDPLEDGAAQAEGDAGVAAIRAEIAELRTRATRNLGFRLTEPAGRDLWLARSAAWQLPDGDERDRTVAEIEELLADADPVFRRRKRAFELLAQDLLELATAYADRPRLALLIVERAVQWDAPSSREALATARAAASRPDGG